jgi:methyl-accepting chemotaxis protein
MKLSDLKIGTRLYLGFGATLLLLVMLVSVAAVNFSRQAAANDMNVHTYQVLAETGGILEALTNIETGQRGFALTGNEASLEPLTKGSAEFKIHLDKARSLTADNPAQQERLTRLESAQRQWMADGIDPVIQLRRGVAGGANTMEEVVAREQQGKGKTGMDAMRALLAEMQNNETSLLTQRTAEALALRSQTQAMLLGGAVIEILLSMLIAYWNASNVVRPLREAIGVARRVAQGDLTASVAVTSKDETGELMEALKTMNDNLRRIVSDVRSGTETIATASTEIARGNLDLSSRTEEQASSLEETASSMEELTGTVQQNAANARQASDLASTASDVAGKGGAVVAQVVDTMGSINASSRKIVDIIAVIDGIAFQTNILALNAAVEAARAGEQGRGFAVVATEVRNLAQRSAGAAREIKTLIGDSVEQVEVGTRLVDQAGATMHDVVESVKRVSDIVAQIASASEEQRSGIEQVNQAIVQMDQVTQQNAALVEQAAAAAESLQEQSARLATAVGIFNTGALSARQAQAPVVRSHAAALSTALAAQTVKAAAGAPSPRTRDNTQAGRKELAAARAASADDWEEF